MKRDEIVAELFRMQDKDYALMQVKILPTVAADRIIGVRTPALRTFAKSLYKDKDKDAFLACAPHQYFDEDQLHAFVISLEKDFDKCIAEVEAFLPFIDNWATCDQLSPKAFKKEPEKLLTYIQTWIKSDKTYAEVRSEEYYVNMMIAWYFATALAKQYEAVLPYLQEKRLADWTHNKAIQKSVESFRITPEQKEYLKTLKVKKSK